MKLDMDCLLLQFCFTPFRSTLSSLTIHLELTSLLNLYYAVYLVRVYPPETNISILNTNYFCRGSTYITALPITTEIYNIFICINYFTFILTLNCYLVSGAKSIQTHSKKGFPRYDIKLHLIQIWSSGKITPSLQ